MKKYPSTPYVIAKLNSMKDKINANPDYQRGNVWSLDQRIKLIESIDKGRYIPEIILAKSAEPYEYEIVDGKQRLHSIFKFLDNKIKYNGRFYNSYTEEEKTNFINFFLNITELEGTPEEIAEQFILLQNGSTLKKQDKRNALAGEIKEFIKEIIQHPFFVELCQVDKNEVKFKEVATQLILLKLIGMTDIKAKNIDKMYEEYNESIPDERKKELLEVLDYLYNSFEVGTKKSYFKKANLPVLYLLADQQLKVDSGHNFSTTFGSWFKNFMDEYKTNSKSGNSQTYNEYEKYNKSGTASKESIEGRIKILTKSWNNWLKKVKQQQDKAEKEIKFEQGQLSAV